ncbi:MAG: hypothetical protein MJ188_07980 [Treponema sp.]|nr:hypothetical protein [Treponema sp.]
MKLLNNLIKKIIPSFCLIVFALLMIVFRSVPVGHIWNGYTVLYIPSQINDAVVAAALEKSQILDYASLNNQDLPASPAIMMENTLEFAMLKINTALNNSDYLKARKNYFYDSTGQYRLYYIPDDYKNNLDECIHILAKSNIPAGIDSSVSYPWLLPVFCLLAAVFFTFFTKDKIFFISSAVIPVLYIFCNPFYASGLSVIILLLVLFFASNVWKRKNASLLILRQIIIPISIVLSLVSAFSSSLLSGVFYIVTLASVFCTIFLYDEIVNFLDTKRHFSFVYIRPAKMLSIFGTNRNKKFIMPVTVGIAALILLYFAFNSSALINNKNTKMLIPGAAEKQSEKLPNLEDYYAWNWNVITSPYKSLNKSYNSDYVVFPRYVEDEQGIISEENSIIYFNDDFKQSLLSEIDNFNFNSIEGILKEQGESFKCGYVSTGAYHVTIFSVIIMLICFAMLLFIYFSVMIKKGGRK